MKKLLILLAAAFMISCKAQTYPLNTSPGDIPDNAYIKDTNNELDKYVGVWKGNWNGKTIYLDLRKININTIVIIHIIRMKFLVREKS